MVMQSWYSSTEKIVQPDWLLRGTFWENGPSFGKWSHFPLKSCLKKKNGGSNQRGGHPVDMEIAPLRS